MNQEREKFEKPAWKIMMAGIALEDLQASLISDLRPSEGARRQQQQFCGPTVALTFNLVVSVGIILMNKLVQYWPPFSFQSN